MKQLFFFDHLVRTRDVMIPTIKAPYSNFDLENELWHFLFNITFTSVLLLRIKMKNR